MDQTPPILQGRRCLFSTQSQSGHTSGEIFFKFYLEPLTSFWQAQDGATRRIQGARGLAVGVWPPVSSRQDMDRTIRGGPAHKIKTCMALLGVHRKTLYSTKLATFLVTLPPLEYIRRGRGPSRSIYYISIQYTKDTGRRVLRRSDSPNLSKSLSLCLVSPSGS